MSADSIRDPLLRPYRLGPVRLPNRIVMAPMTRNRCREGTPTEAVASYYARRAAAGVGLIVTEGVGIDHPSAMGRGSIEEKYIPLLYGNAPLAGWRTVVERVHASSGIIFPQLWHMGPIREHGTGPHPQAQSSRPSGVWGPTGRSILLAEDYVSRVLPCSAPMSDSEIADVVESFARCAANAVAAGFDGIALHGGHGYLLDAFLWSETNCRTDEWGGSLERRARFPAEVVRAIRLAIGPETPILFRYSNWKLQDYAARLAATPAELERMLRPLVDAGVTIFEASTRRFDDPAFEGSALTLAAWTKKVTGRASMAVGGIGLERDMFGGRRKDGLDAKASLAILRARLEAEEFDLAGVGRALLIDPEWVRKVERDEPFVQLTSDILKTFYDDNYELV